MEITYKLSDLENVAKQIIAHAQSKIILFDAEMGMGKTTLIKEIVRVLGVKDVANSPTFSIVNEYKTSDNGTIYHFDMYRIEEEEEALDFGIEEYFYSNNWCFIEWPERIPNLIPEEHHVVRISIEDETTRTLNFE
jgi:tRNA threonylcarbamoyladenosine biosynthesis protein TsaE